MQDNSDLRRSTEYKLLYNEKVKRANLVLRNNWAYLYKKSNIINNEKGWRYLS